MGTLSWLSTSWNVVGPVTFGVGRVTKDSFDPSIIDGHLRFPNDLDGPLNDSGPSKSYWQKTLIPLRLS